ncbi:MAG: hypothetical protein AMJ79_03485 [Phycisphaerae bacterium SM23_30]|nr:MAG: hypothetical protein AMJ79_03485 [Phycisphaerae bacterium SM23_30]
MNKNIMVIRLIIPVAAAALGIIILALWAQADTPLQIEMRIPDTSDITLANTKNTEPIGNLAELIVADGVPADIPGAWPRFRGANFDNIYLNQEVPLAPQWPESGPPVLWSLEMGEGYAGPAVRNGRVFVLDYDRDQQKDALRCLSLADGKEIWRFTYPIVVKRNHGMSRTVPAVTDKYVVSLGPKCHVACLDPNSGKMFWMLDLVRDFKTKVPLWYAGQCPLIDAERAIIAPAGEPLMMAIDCPTGEIIWQTPNEHNWQMTHSSIIPLEFAGKKMYVYCASGGVVGVSAEDGSILWETSEWKIRSATVPSPVVVGNGRIFFTGGYNAGSVMMQLKEHDDKIVPEVVFRLTAEVFSSDQQTPILYNGYLFAVRPKPDEQLACMDPDGNIVWSSGSTNKFQLGPLIIANGLIYIMNDTGLLTLLEATPQGYRQLAQAQVLAGHDSWGPMAMVSGRLLLRDLTRMVCLDVSTH